MKKQYLLSLFFLLCVVLALPCVAQTDQTATAMPTSVPPEEHKVGDYIVAGDIEAGYRFTGISGADYTCPSGTGICNYEGMYNSLVDLHQGPRLFNQSLSMRAIGNTGVFFDNLFVSSFGWGGDPNNVARLRVSKHKIYNFTALFRRDYQHWDYNLLANPLNPSTSDPNKPVLFSPHRFDTVRRMSDVNLTLFPVSVITARFGFSRNRFQGPSYSTFHMPRGTDIELLQNYSFTNDSYRAGFDLKFIPRTTMSFDAIVNHYKNDTNLNDPPYFFGYTVAGQPADLGISWNTLANQPCAPASIGTPACNLAFSFFRQDRFRTTAPNLWASLESHYWKRLDLSIKALYGWADLDSNYFQNWTGKAGSINQETIANSPIRNRRISSAVDAGATFFITDNLRVSETFRFSNQRMPQFGVSSDTTYPASDAVTPTGPPSTATTVLMNGLFIDTKENETSVGYDISRYAGLTIGYRYTHRIFQLNGEAFGVDPNTGALIPPDPADVGYDRFLIPQHTGFGALWFAPSDKLRINFDADIGSAGISYVTLNDTGTGTVTFNGITTFTRITPRHHQQYRARVHFKPMRYVTIAGTLNDWEQSNSLQDIQYKFHNRNFGFNVDASPNERISFDVAYNYQDVLQNDLICFTESTGPGNSPGSALAAATSCPADAGLPYEVFGDYKDTVHYGSFFLRAKPVKRVTATLGYSIISNNGSFAQLNALQPVGPLAVTYHRPLAALEVELYKGVALKGDWNYYGYNEKDSSANVFGSGGPTIPRDFHANTGSISLRYSF